MLPGMASGNAYAGVTILQSLASAYNGGGTASLVVSKPTGAISGDILIGGMCAALSRTWTGDTGWTEILDQGTAPSLRAAYLVAGGSEPSSYTFTASSSVAASGAIACFRGYTYDTASSSASTLSGDGDLSISGITVTGGILIAIVVTDNASPVSHSTPSGFQLAGFQGGSGGFGPAVSVFWKQVAAGATGSVTSTIGTTAGSSSGILIALKP